MIRARLSLGTAAMALVFTCLTACDRYRPALFADRPVVTHVDDDLPIPVPPRREFDEHVQVSDVYLRRPLFDQVHPLDFPWAGDVNALDEVPASSWYDPEGTLRNGMPKVRVPRPTLPFSVTNEKPLVSDSALVVRDAAGLRYEILCDPAGQEGLRTGAEILGGYLLRSVGLNAPMAYRVRVQSSDLRTPEGDATARARLRSWLKNHGTSEGAVRHVSATFFPDGVDVGIGSDFSVRGDDGNDTVNHEDRRTLRAMKVFGNWIGWKSFGVRQMRDVYVGAPGKGHLVHYLIGTSRAFGTTELREQATLDESGGSFGWNLVTLGLSSPVVRAERESRFPSLGYLPSGLDPEHYDVSPSYSPFVRFQPVDEYWATKRLLEAGDGALRAGIAAAGFSGDAGRHLLKVLVRRRQLLVAHGLSSVTPLEVAGTSGRVVLLRDRAITAHFALAAATQYDVRFLGSDGHELGSAVHLEAVGAITGVRVPDDVTGRVVLHVTAVRHGHEAPRACDVHLEVTASEARVIGLRH